MIIGNKEFKNHTYIMGILNVTPDSFSDGGNYNSTDRALKRAEQMIAEGADIIDIGGESTRPGYTQISDAEEISRTAPIIEKIKSNFDIPISIDTYKSNVAEAALVSGADMVNDIWGFKYDKNIAHITTKHNAACCLMHNRKSGNYSDFMTDVISDLNKSIEIARANNIPGNKIIIDPGVGFAKTYEQNLEIINKLECLHSLGYPLLLAVSRKSVIGLTLNLPPQDRLEGTIAASVMAVIKKALFVRVHDIKENKRAILMTEAILGAK